jgi:uncharacterized repeat protein (TIGR01451 family)
MFSRVNLGPGVFDACGQRGRWFVGVLVAGCLWVAPAAAAATFTVNDTGDAPLGLATWTTCVSTSSSCTLRAAVQAADNSGGPSSIMLPAGTFKLTIAPSTAGGSDDPAHGDLDIDQLNEAASAPSVTITGQGAGSTIIDANSIDRAFSVHYPAELSLADLAITDGSAPATQSSSSDFDPANGGAIDSSGSLTITDSELYENTATRGGAVYSQGPLTVTGSTFTADSAPIVGGAIATEYGPTELTNDTLDGNQSNAGGGIGYLSPTDTPEANSEIANLTIAHNTGHGISYAFEAGTIDNTIVAENSPSNCFDPASVSSEAGAADAGGNLDSDGSCFSAAVTGDKTGVDPMLGPLADNGGPSETDALQAGSPAIGETTASAFGPSSCPATDQRHVARLAGFCDSGAYQGLEADLALSASATPAVETGQGIEDTFTVANHGPYAAEATFTDPLPGGASYASVSTTQGTCTGTAMVSCSLGTINAGGSATVTVELTALQTGTVENAASVSTSAIDANPQDNSASADTLVSGRPGYTSPPPMNIDPPDVHGTPSEGETLSATTGTWTNAPTSYAYRWQDCTSDTESSCTPIDGATGSTFALADALAGHEIRVIVTASNAFGSTSAISPLIPPVGLSVTGSVTAAATTYGDAAAFVYSCRDASGKVNFNCVLIAILSTNDGTGARDLGAEESKAHAKTHIKTAVVGRETVTIRRGHKKRLTIKLNATGRRLLAKNHKLKVTLTITQKHGKTLRKAITFKTPRKPHRR